MPEKPNLYRLVGILAGSKQKNLENDCRNPEKTGTIAPGIAPASSLPNWYPAEAGMGDQPNL